MQIWSLRIWRRRLFARTAWNGCRRGRFKRERALRRERDGGRDGSRDPRDRARERGHTNPKSHSKSNRTKTGERRSAAYLFSRPKKIYMKRERETFESAPGTPRRDPQNRNRTTASRERRIERRTARVATVDDKANICFELLFLVRA